MTTKIGSYCERSRVTRSRCSSAFLAGALTRSVAAPSYAVAQQPASDAGQGSSSAIPGARSLSPTPPMGWNSWNHFANNVTDADVRAAQMPWSQVV